MSVESAIFTHLRLGGQLESWIRTRGLDPAEVYTWLNQDPARGQRWVGAINQGSQTLRERILTELTGSAFLDARTAYGKDEQLLPPSQWSDEIAGSVKRVKTREEIVDGERVGEVRDVEFVDRLKAREMLGKELGMFREKVDVHVAVSYEDILDGTWDKKPTAQVITDGEIVKDELGDAGKAPSGTVEGVESEPS